MQSAAGNRYPRRAVLMIAGSLAAGSGLGGCAVLGPDTRWRAADPLAPLLKGTVALADRYDAIIRAVPSLAARLTPLRDDHRSHAIALAREMGLDERAPLGATPSLPGIPVTPSAGPPQPGATPPGSPQPGATSARPSASASAAPPRNPAPTVIPIDPINALAQLVTLERVAQEDAMAACLSAPGYRAATLGSIAACRASHLEALR